MNDWHRFRGAWGHLLPLESRDRYFRLVMATQFAEQFQSRLFGTNLVPVVSKLHVIVPVVVRLQFCHGVKYSLAMHTLEMLGNVTGLVAFQSFLRCKALLAFWAFDAAVGYIKGQNSSLNT